MKGVKNGFSLAAALALLLFFVELFSKAGVLLKKAAGMTAAKPRGADGCAQPGTVARGAADRQALADACVENKKNVMFIGCNGMYE